jgi:hypothetical protein
MRLFGYFWLSSLFLGLGPGCSAPEHSGFQPLREGRLPAAALALRAREGELGSLSEGARARYALQRGLSELGLGNARAADYWLTRAKRADAADPACFDRLERGALLSAWRSLGRMPGETP